MAGGVHGGGMHDGGHVWGGHAWWEACMVGGGCAWWGHAWQGRRACVVGACMARIPPPAPDTTRYGRSMSGRYTSYWKAFLSFNLGKIKFNLSLNASLAFSTGNLEGLGGN